LKSKYQPAIDLIKHFEGLRTEAYLDPVGIPTIGYGITNWTSGHPVKMGDTITEEMADEYLLNEVDRLAYQIKQCLYVELSNSALCALISLVYNIGLGAFKRSTLLSKLNRGESLEDVATEFLRWVKAKDKVLIGLQIRRNAERILFLSNDPVN